MEVVWFVNGMDCLHFEFTDLSFDVIGSTFARQFSVIRLTLTYLLYLALPFDVLRTGFILKYNSCAGKFQSRMEK